MCRIATWGDGGGRGCRGRARTARRPSAPSVRLRPTRTERPRRRSTSCWSTNCRCAGPGKPDRAAVRELATARTDRATRSRSRTLPDLRGDVTRTRAGQVHPRPAGVVPRRQGRRPGRPRAAAAVRRHQPGTVDRRGQRAFRAARQPVLAGSAARRHHRAAHRRQPRTAARRPGRIDRGGHRDQQPGAVRHRTGRRTDRRPAACRGAAR